MNNPTKTVNTWFQNPRQNPMADINFTSPIPIIYLVILSNAKMIKGKTSKPTKDSVLLTRPRQRPITPNR